MSLEISVPCPDCSGPLRFGQSACDQCGAVVSAESKSALEQRLEASSEDYKGLKDEVAAAFAVLVILALVYVATGVLGYAVVTKRTFVLEAQRTEAFYSLIANVAVGAAFGVCAAFARKKAFVAIAAATALWVLLHAALAVASPLVAFGGLWFKAVALVLLGRGLLAAWRTRAYMRRLAADVGRARVRSSQRQPRRRRRPVHRPHR